MFCVFTPSGDREGTCGFREHGKLLVWDFIGLLCKPRNISLCLASIFLSTTFVPYHSLNQSPTLSPLRITLDPPGLDPSTLPEPQPRTQGSTHKEEQIVPCGHCLRRDSGQSTFADRPTRNFPTLSLRSHSPPGEASCTQHQESPPLTRLSPSGHTAGPDPSRLRTEHPLLSPDLSPQNWEDSRVLMLSEGSRLKSTGPS